MSHLINYEAVYRTAPATSGLLIIVAQGSTLHCHLGISGVLRGRDCVDLFLDEETQIDVVEYNGQGKHKSHTHCQWAIKAKFS